MGQPLTLRAALPGLGRLVRRLWPYVRRERPLIVVSLLALYAEIGLRLLEPWPLKVVLDHVVGAGHHDRWVDRVLAALDPGTLLALAAVAGVAFAGLRALAAYYNTLGLALPGNPVLTPLRNELYAPPQRLSLSFHTRARTRALILVVGGDVRAGLHQAEPQESRDGRGRHATGGRARAHGGPPHRRRHGARALERRALRAARRDDAGRPGHLPRLLAHRLSAGEGLRQVHRPARQSVGGGRARGRSAGPHARRARSAGRRAGPPPAPAPAG